MVVSFAKCARIFLSNNACVGSLLQLFILFLVWLVNLAYLVL